MSRHILASRRKPLLRPGQTSNFSPSSDPLLSRPSPPPREVSEAFSSILPLKKEEERERLNVQVMMLGSFQVCSIFLVCLFSGCAREAGIGKSECITEPSSLGRERLKNVEIESPGFNLHFHGKVFGASKCNGEANGCSSHLMALSLEEDL